MDEFDRGQGAAVKTGVQFFLERDEDAKRFVLGVVRLDMINVLLINFLSHSLEEHLLIIE